MSEDRRLAHIERIPMRWGDMDANGHVNNTVYFRYMEQARIGWFDALVPEAEAWKTTGIVVANATATTSARWCIRHGRGEALCRQAGGSSVLTSYEMHIEGDRHLYADGAAMVVFIDMAKQKPVRIPDSIRERLLHAAAE
jgi:acyl-CoA thioester hydrolase